MPLNKDKKQVAISMPISKYKELKKLAVDHDMSLSQLLVTAGTVTNIGIIKKNLEDTRGVPSG